MGLADHVIGCVVISDRGDRYLPECLANLADNLDPWVPVLVVDDADHHLGMAGAVRTAFQIAVDENWQHLLLWEEDFRALVPIPVAEMAAILDRAPHLAQVVLVREPVTPMEHAAGGLLQLDPMSYADRSFGPMCDYLEHGRIRDWGWSSNPTLIPRRVLEMGYPDGNENQQTTLMEAAGLSFAFYGRRDDSPRVRHVGTVRGTGWRL